MFWTNLSLSSTLFSWMVPYMGDFGESYRLGGPAQEFVLDRLPYTAELALITLIMSLSLALPQLFTQAG